jgi:hypothetical protein
MAQWPRLQEFVPFLLWLGHSSLRWGGFVVGFFFLFFFSWTRLNQPAAGWGPHQILWFAYSWGLCGTSVQVTHNWYGSEVGTSPSVSEGYVKLGLFWRVQVGVVQCA